MKIKSGQRIRQISVLVSGKKTGLLEKNAQFEFTYHSDSQFPVAVAMPLAKRFYQHGALFPIFEMNIPEGYIRQRITEKLRKHIQIDDMLFLALQGSAGIGRISYESEGIEQEQPGAENLTEILAWKGDKNLFEELLNKHLLQSNISGVQPKILVPERITHKEKGSLVLPSLIIKSGDEGFPQIAINEYICMQLARSCQIETPEFWLSDNQKLFVMRRFDLNKDGGSLAMEDMAVLQGKSTNNKYQSSYESIGKVLNLFSAKINDDKRQFFKMLVHSCMVGNGDAHLKNFAMLYSDPYDMRLSPVYDVVNTQIYTPRDRLALNLGKSKIFPERKRIVDFGKSLGIKHPEVLLDEMADQIRDGLETLADYTEAMSHDIKSSIMENIHRSTTRTATKIHPARTYTKHN